MGQKKDSIMKKIDRSQVPDGFVNSRKKSAKIALWVLFILSCISSGSLLAYSNEALHVRRDGRPLIQQKRFDEAIEHYVKAAEKTPDVDNNFAFLKVASELALWKLKDVVKAMALAQKMRDPNYAKSQRLVLLGLCKKYQKIIDEYKDVDINTWPLKCRLESFYYRADAYLKLKDIKSAEPDLRAALNTHGKIVIRGNACKLLGEMYQNKYKNDEQALEFYRKGLTLTKAPFAWRSGCLFHMVDILLKQNKSSEAIALFKPISYEKLPGDYWRVLFHLKQAEALRAGNYNGQAATHLMTILRMGAATDGQKARAQKQLDALITEMRK